MPSRYASDRAILVQAFQLEHGRKPTRNEAQVIQSIAEHETNFGRGWGTDPEKGAGSNNVGAMQGQPGFRHIDHHADGTEYTTWFRSYPTLVDGCRHLIRWVTTWHPTVWRYIKVGNYAATAREMRRAGYYEAPEKSYYAAMLKAGTKIASELQEPLASNTLGGLVISSLGIGAALLAAKWTWRHDDPRKKKR